MQQRYVATLLVLIGGLFIYHACTLAPGLDDAFIIYAYARRFAEGRGLVLNAGEYVEGYTCFLWTVLLGGVYRLGFDLADAAPVISAAFGLAVLPLTYAGARALGARGWVALIAPALLAAMPAYGYWGGSGMETLPVTFLISLAVYLFARSPDTKFVPCLLALAVMTRPDSVIVVGVVALERFVHWRAGRPFWLWMGTFMTVFLPYYAWRYAYYGYLLPNTFYVKVGSSSRQIERGIRYLRAFLFDGGGLSLAVLACPALLWKRRPAIWSLAGICVLYAAYGIAVGGDFMGLHRLLVPSFPLWAILTSLSMEWLLKPARGPAIRPVATVAIGAVLVMFSMSMVGDFSTAKKRSLASRRLVKMQEARAQRMSRVCGPRARVAAIGIGVYSYRTEWHIIDMLGLADEHIAHRKMPDVDFGIPGHEKHDSDYVLDLVPKCIDIPRGGSLVAAVADMSTNPRFAEGYEWSQSASCFVRKP